MLSMILVVQLRLSSELEFFSYFSSLDLEMIWIPTTSKEESMKMIIRVIAERNAIVIVMH